MVCGLQGKTDTSTSSNFRWWSWFSSTSWNPLLVQGRHVGENRQLHHGCLHQQENLLVWPWNIPQVWGALSQEADSIGEMPALGQPLQVLLLRGTG